MEFYLRLYSSAKDIHKKISNLDQLGVKCAGLTGKKIEDENAMSSDCQVIFIGPEVLKIESVRQILLLNRKRFILKVIDEAHLGMQLRLFLIQFTFSLPLKVGNHFQR